MLKKLFILYAIIFNIIVSLISCSEDEVCDNNCDLRFDTCNTDCEKNNPPDSQKLRDCKKHCDAVHDKCISKCYEINP